MASHASGVVSKGVIYKPPSSAEWSRFKRYYSDQAKDKTGLHYSPEAYTTQEINQELAYVMPYDSAIGVYSDQGFAWPPAFNQGRVYNESSSVTRLGGRVSNPLADYYTRAIWDYTSTGTIYSMQAIQRGTTASLEAPFNGPENLAHAQQSTDAIMDLISQSQMHNKTTTVYRGFGDFYVPGQWEPDWLHKIRDLQPGDTTDLGGGFLSSSFNKNVAGGFGGTVDFDKAAAATKAGLAIYNDDWMIVNASIDIPPYGDRMGNGIDLTAYNEGGFNLYGGQYGGSNESELLLPIGKQYGVIAASSKYNQDSQFVLSLALEML